VHISEVIPPDEEVVQIEEDVDPSAETVVLGEKQAAAKKPAKQEEEVARPGMTIGNYEIIEEIARGAVGVVYKARQKNLNRVVALKILLAGQAASEEQVQRFHQEALAVAKLRHPNIVPVYDVGVFEGKHYIAMEYVDGRPLHHLMKSKRFTPNEALDIILKVADAIAHAHKHGIVHRDIKPANIMMDDTGRVQVMDFGLAKEVETDAQFTRSGTTMGTPNYMPVEQAQGDNKNIDERSDIYSLGAVLYEMLTGVPPFVADTNLKTILKVINEEPLPPRRRNPYIHRDVETICIKAMEKDKTRRYETVQGFMEDIERFKSGEPIQARPPSTAYRISKKIRKHAAVIGASLGTIIIAVAVLMLFRVIFPQQPPTPPENPSVAAPTKTSLIYKLMFPDDMRKPALVQAGAKEVYLTDRGLDANLPEGALPEQILASQDVEVKPDGDGTLSLCLYARTEMPTFDNYYAGLVATLHFAHGALQAVTFKGNDRFPMAMPVEPKDGLFRVLLWRERKEEDKLYLSVNNKILTWKIDGMPTKTGNGVGVALYGKGIDFGPIVLEEVIPPWETLVKTADELFKSNTAYASARKVYEKAFKEYASDPQAKIPEAELARVQLNIAICMVHQAGLYSDNPVKPGQFDPPTNALQEIITRYAAGFPAIAESADVYLLHIRFLMEDIDLKKEANALVQKYPDLKVEDLIKDVFSRFPASILGPRILEKETTDVNTLNILAQHYLDNENLEEACEVLLRVAKDYEAQGDFDNARSEYDRTISKIDFSRQPETGDYYKKLAKIRRGELFLLAGKFEEYDRAADEVLYFYERRVPEKGGFVFDSDLAKFKVGWGKNLFTKWFANPSRTTNDDYVQRAYKILGECLLYLEPSVTPPPAALDDKWLHEQIQHQMWLATISSSSAELVRVGYALDRPAAEIYQHFQRFKGSARELQAGLMELASEAFSRSGEYTRARRLSFEIISNFRDVTSAGLKAVNTLAETHVLEGMDKRGDASDVNMKELADALMILETMDLKERSDVELKVDAILKATFTDIVKYTQHGLETDAGGKVKIGPDGQPVETEIGASTRKELVYMWDKMKATIDAGGLESDSYIKRIHEIIMPLERGQVSPDQISAYENSIPTEKDPYKRGEMKFALGMRLQFTTEQKKIDQGKQLLDEVLKEDPLRQYWFTRFLEEYLKEKHEPPPPINDKA
jgi:serine/threonine protein kinase